MNHAWTRFLPARVRLRIEGRKNLQQIISNTGWLFADKLIRMGAGLIVGVWVARYLGPEQFGLLNFTGSFVTLFATISLLGLETIVVRELVKNPSLTAEILGTTCFVRFVAAFVAFAAALGTIFVLRPGESLTHLLVAIAGSAMFFHALDVIDLWFQSEVKSKYVVIAKNTAFLASAAAKVAMILLNASLVAFACANLAEIVLGAVGLAVVYRLNGMRLAAWRVKATLVKEFLKDCLPLMLSGLIFMVYLRVDQVMLGQMVGDREVGVYAAAVRVAEIWYFIPTAIVSSVFPDIVRSRESGEVIFYDKLQKLYNLLVFVGYAVALPMTFLAGWVVTVLFGANYATAGTMLAVLVWAGVFANLGVARNAYLLAINNPRSLLLAMLAGAVSNVLLNLVLIPSYGGTGAAVASCISYWVAAHGACYLIRPLYRAANMISRAILFPRFW